jgi:hypothetical protein
MNRAQFVFGHGCLVLVIIDNLDIMRVTIAPLKTDAPLIVDADAPLPLTVGMKLFKPIRRRHSQIRESRRAIQHSQLAQRNLLNIIRKLPRPLKIEDLFGFFALERPNHALMV